MVASGASSPMDLALCLLPHWRSPPRSTIVAADQAEAVVVTVARWRSLRSLTPSWRGVGHGSPDALHANRPYSAGRSLIPAKLTLNGALIQLGLPATAPIPFRPRRGFQQRRTAQSSPQQICIDDASVARLPVRPCPAKRRQCRGDCHASGYQLHSVEVGSRRREGHSLGLAPCFLPGCWHIGNERLSGGAWPRLPSISPVPRRACSSPPQGAGRPGTSPDLLDTATCDGCAERTSNVTV